MAEYPPVQTDWTSTAELPCDGATWNAELLERLQALLHRAERPVRTLELKLPALEREHGEAVYAELIFLMSHLRFEPEEARRHWTGILAHRETMAAKLGSDVDLRVALVSYFLDVERRLENPKVIELKLFEQTQASAYRDDLTGLCNYRLFREHLSREIFQAERYGSPLSLVMIDIDNFKQYNDQHGHEAGNEVLATMARLLGKALRRSDIPVRYGGEEFVLVLPSTSKNDAFHVAERARRSIEEHPFPGREFQPGGILTASMGVATFPADASSAGRLVQRADGAMYVAKARGKNQVYPYGEDRRSYGRIQAELNGKFCVMAPDFHSLTTVNISERGLLFLVDHELPLGSPVDVRLILPENDHEISTTGRVVRVEEMSDGRFEAAIRILEIDQRDRSLLSAYIQRSAELEGSED